MGLIVRLFGNFRAVLEAYGDESTRDTFRGELNYEAGKLCFTLLITLVAWVHYIPIDLRLHQFPVFAVCIRGGLSVVSAGLLALKFTKRFRNRCCETILAMLLYLNLGTALVSATAGEYAGAYIGGLCLVFMISIFAAVPVWIKVAYTTVAYMIFLATGALTGMDFSSDVIRYPMNDLFTAFVLSIMISFIVESVRYQSWQRRQEFKAASRAKSDFLAKMSHEIRTPMNAITGMAELALRETRSLAAAQEHVRTIKQAGGNLLSIINDILDISKIESGKLEIVPVEYHTASLIVDVVNIIKMRLIDSNVRFDVYADCDLPSVLYGDEVRVRQILLNILSNAVKYTSEGSITFTVWVAGPPRNESQGIDVKDDSGPRRDKQLDVGADLSIPHSASRVQRSPFETVTLVMEISDTGKGIREEDMEMLFDSFVQVDTAANRGIEGTGLGLSIAKNLTSAMGGNIAVKSVYGEGCTFTVTLPQGIRSREPVGWAVDLDRPVEARAAGFRAPDARALVVDDIATNLKVAQGLLSPYGMRVDSCLSGEEAVDMVKKNRYDIVFMDHMMPGMDGVEVVRRMRALGDEFERYRYLKNTPVVALTANAVSGAREMFMENGFDDFLSKPIDVAKLDAALERWLPAGKRVNAERGMRNAERKSKDKNKNDADVHSALIIDGVDVKLGIGRTGGKTAEYFSTLGVFRDDGWKKIDEIREARDAGDLRLYVTYVHGLKGASANIGALRLSELAKELESAGKRGDTAFVNAHTDRLLMELESLLEGIDRVLSETKEELGDIDVCALKSLLAGLQAAIGALDPAGMSAAARRLAPFENAADAGMAAKIKTIRKHVLNGDYDEAVAVIGSLS